MRRFDIPAAPPLAGGRGDLLRLVDPRGLAVAWLDLRTGAMIGYATHPAGVTVGGWRELLGGVRERDGAAPDVSDGGAIAVGWPWVGVTSREWPVRWQLSERDPTAATLLCHCKHDGDPPLAADLALNAALDDGALCLRLVARTTAATAAFRAQLLLAVPEARADWHPPNAPDAMIDGAETLVLRRGGATWRLLVTPEPGCAITRIVEDDEAGMILAFSSMLTPHHSDRDSETVCALTLMLVPLE